MLDIKHSVSRHWASKSAVQLVTKLVSHGIVYILVLICLVSIVLWVTEVLSLFRLEEAGHGDSYILYDVLLFQKTGIIYRDLSEPPYLPALYSPLMYILYSLPGRVFSSQNPFVGPRLVAIAAFLACTGIIASIVRKLFPSAAVWIWGIVLPFTTESMWGWILQIRGDFPAIALSLLALRLLLSQSRWAVVLAGVCAGLALQFKIVYVAAAISGTLWLVVQKRWKDVVRFAFPAAICSVGLYLLYSLREPGMISQMLAMSPGIVNVTGNLTQVDGAVTELVMLMAVLGVASIYWPTSPQETLIGIFVVISLAVAAMMNLQVGGNVNYYFEALFGVIPIAVLGLRRLTVLARRDVLVGVMLAALLAIHFLLPRAVSVYDNLGILRHGWVVSGNTEFRQMERVLAGHRFFSATPRLALLDPRPPLMEPFMLTYMHRLGKVDPTLIVNAAFANKPDVVITYAAPHTYRGISLVDPVLRRAITASYEPYCKFGGYLFHLPKDIGPGNSPMAQELRKINCVPVSGDTDW